MAGGYDKEETGTDLATLVAWFEDAIDATEDARKAAERDRDYFDHKQLTAEEKKTLRDRGQPDVVINRIQPKINYLLGWEAVNRTDPRAFPRTPMDEDAAEAATDALRYVHDATDLQQIFSLVWEYLLIEGYGGVELTVEPSEQGDPEIVPIAWDWDRLFFDPHSRKHDYSDARYLGGILWLDVEDAKARWQDFAEDFDRMVTEETFQRTFDDRPAKWVSKTNGQSKRARVRIVQMYHKENGRWMHCTFTQAAKLEAIEVPFVDHRGQSWCPMLMASSFVDRENNRYGLVRAMIGVQDEINKRRSKALHRLTMRQVKVQRGAVDDIDEVRKQLSKPDAVIEINPGFDIEVLQSGDQLQAELTLLQEAKNEIELLGPNAAMLGKDADAPSGRAILANKESGQTEISYLLDRHRHLKKRVYQRIWDLIRQYKKAEWWVRVTDDEKNVKFVGLNRPVTAQEELVKRLQSQGMPPEQIEAQMQQAMSDPMLAQQMQQVVRLDNNPTQMQMDITIEEVPDSANVQMEQFQQLTQMAPAVVFPPEVYIEASSLRNKKRLLEIMKGGAQQDPVAAEAQKIQLEQAIEKTQAETDKLKAEALKVRVEADMADAQIGQIINPTVIDAAGSPAPQSAGPVAESAPPAETGASGMPPPGF